MVFGRHGRWQRRMQRAFRDPAGVRGPELEDLRTHLRGSAEDRAQWDAAWAVMREIGEHDVSPIELESVESWLFETAPEPTARRRGSMWTALATVAAVAGAVALIVVPGGESDEFAARGSGELHDGLGIEVFCGDPPRIANEAECRIDEVMSFAARPPRGSASVGTLTVFGVTDDGALRYYSPTPVDPAVMVPASPRTEALPLSVRLNVNHRAERVRVFALWSSTGAPDARALDRWAAALHADEGVGTDGATWMQILENQRDPDLMTTCPAECSAAATVVTITDPESRP
jgi:hypothetical protein